MKPLRRDGFHINSAEFIAYSTPERILGLIAAARAGQERNQDLDKTENFQKQAPEPSRSATMSGPGGVCPTCGGDGESEASAFDGHCPAAWAHSLIAAYYDSQRSSDDAR